MDYIWIIAGFTCNLMGFMGSLEKVVEKIVHKESKVDVWFWLYVVVLNLLFIIGYVSMALIKLTK
ncbi:hypothetical protein vBBceHLY2_00146 [Bacillus phage vB_BceH_LY2]|nr:hypothetical protein vBBceHLY2_00146 [Bacillus phage vB_BceH_LY2]